MEHLIEMVRSQPILYNTNHQDYLKLSLKESVWQHIAEELNYDDGAQVKTAWLKLRNCHRDALRRKERNGATKVWKYENEMEFLMPYMAMAGRTIENSQDQLSDNDNPCEVKTCKRFVATKRKKNNTDIYDIQAETSELSEERAKYRNEKLQNSSSTAENDDDLYHFYMSMYNVTKKLPTSRQIQIKRTIFNLVTEEQEKALCGKSTTPLSFDCSFESKRQDVLCGQSTTPLSFIDPFDIKREEGV